MWPEDEVPPWPRTSRGQLGDELGEEAEMGVKMRSFAGYRVAVATAYEYVDV